MKYQILTILICMISNIDRNNYYDALASENLTTINIMIDKIKKENPTSINNAYLGSLIAKKAVFAPKIKEKIRVFKEGITLLEDEISKNPEIIEYRFLRLILQEKCPRVLGYYQKIPEDSKIIIQEYPKLDDKLKLIILKYSNESKALKNKI